MCAAEEVFGSKRVLRGFYRKYYTRSKGGARNFYNYFPSKKDIFDELIRRLNRELRLIIKGEMKGISSYEEAQRRGFQAFFRWVKDRPNLYNIVQQAVVVDDNLYRWYYAKLANGFLKSLSAGMEAGEFKWLDKETIAYCLMSIGQF